MSVGVVVDHGHGRNYPERWQKGEAEKSFWLGLKEHKSEQRDVETWCCDRCGLLRSYALPKDS